ncbi:MAG TPA: hypothetical protein VGA61_09440, partial [Anaerolineae bacterium]
QEALVQKGTRGRARAIATGRLRRVETADNHLAKSLDSQISELKKKLSAYPNSDRYQADAIALDTGTEYNHLPVYDHGVPLK